jgi:FixJ family two-component response regulator
MNLPLRTTTDTFGPVSPPSQANILIADDEVLVSSPLRKMLTQRGYNVECVETGWDAARALSTGRFGLLVADICMPGNTALDVLHSPDIRQLQIPVIVITGHPSVETAVDALRLAVVDYFVKPIPPQSFLDSVQRALERRQAMQTVRELEQRVGSVTAVLQSVKSTLEAAGRPLIATGKYEARADETTIQSRLSSEDFAILSRREREILSMIGQGESTSSVATQLGISVSTVRNHLKSIYRKVGVSSQVSLVRKLLM